MDAPSIRKRATGTHFYRYSKFSGETQAWLKEIILEHRLYVPTLPELNDPTDGRPRLARLSDDQMFHFLYDGPFGLLKRNPRMTVEDQIRHGVILDYNITHHGADVLSRELQKLMNGLMEGYRVYSLSKRYDNLNLWAKYAGNHSGYCLEFANEGAFFGAAQEVTYGDSVEVDVNDRGRLNGYWFFCKRCDWSGEEEVRVVVPPRFPCKVQIDPICFTRIILGWRMPEENRAQIREWAKQRDPELTVVTAHYDELDQVLKLKQ
jgi:hypothetical protein